MVPASMTATTTTLQLRERIFLTVDACMFMLKSVVGESRDERRSSPPRSTNREARAAGEPQHVYYVDPVGIASLPAQPLDFAAGVPVVLVLVSAAPSDSALRASDAASGDGSSYGVVYRRRAHGWAYLT